MISIFDLVDAKITLFKHFLEWPSSIRFKVVIGRNFLWQLKSPFAIVPAAFSACQVVKIDSRSANADLVSYNRDGYAPHGACRPVRLSRWGVSAA
jgi:hypothetical protein